MGIRTWAVAILAAVMMALDSAPAAAEPPMRSTGLAEPRLQGAHDGGYIGITGGLNASSLDAPEGPDWAETGVFGGAYIGWGLTQQGTYVGIEMDAMWRDIRSTATDGATTITLSNRWLASARGRLGVPIGPALLYGTGGIAVQEAVLRLTDPAAADKDGAWVLGLVGGGGIEARLTQAIHVRVEGLHYVWRDETFYLAGEQAKIGQADTVIRVGIGFRLN